MALDEFAIISQYFAKLGQFSDGVVLGIGDDAAILRVPAEHDLVVTVDTLVAGVHFPETTAPVDIGYKAVAVNLSDLAAMGATPKWLTLALTLPQVDQGWIVEFCRGFAELLQEFSVSLVGGDLTRGPLVMSIQAHGLLPKGQGLRRSNARPGDSIYVTQTLGDAALALAIQQGTIKSHQDLTALNQRLNRPRPQLETGLILLNIANSAIDISDGLLADLNHILTASKVGATIYTEQIPLSASLKKLTSEQALAFALQGGDDYQLCFTVNKVNEPKLQGKMAEIGVDYHCIGHIDDRLGLRICDKHGKITPLQPVGYQHFKDQDEAE